MTAWNPNALTTGPHLLLHFFSGKYVDNDRDVDEFDHNDDVVAVGRASDGLCKFQVRLASALFIGETRTIPRKTENNKSIAGF